MPVSVAGRIVTVEHHNGAFLLGARVKIVHPVAVDDDVGVGIIEIVMAHINVT